MEWITIRTDGKYVGRHKKSKTYEIYEFQETYIRRNIL